MHHDQIKGFELRRLTICVVDSIADSSHCIVWFLCLYCRPTLKLLWPGPSRRFKHNTFYRTEQKIPQIFLSLAALSDNITFPAGLANNPSSMVCTAAVNDPRPAAFATVSWGNHRQLGPDLAFSIVSAVTASQKIQQRNVHRGSRAAAALASSPFLMSKMKRLVG